jgi:hypothetical protein
MGGQIRGGLSMMRPFGEGVPPPRAFPGSAAPSNSRFNNQLWISLLALPALASMRVLNDDALLRDALIGNFALLSPGRLSLLDFEPHERGEWL